MKIINRKKKILGFLLAGMIFLICGISVWAEGDTKNDADIEVNEEAMFGDDGTSDAQSESGTADGGIVEEITTETTVADMEKGLLKSKTTIGGSYSFSVISGWKWIDPDFSGDTFVDSLSNPDDESLTTDLKTTVYLDSRPVEDFRVFGKVDVAYPFDGNTVSVRELFSDFNWNNFLFLRGGKQTINWGVGYFFSPADIVNLSPIDPEDPEAEREGPIALKINMPLNIHNLYLYLIDNDIDKPWEITVAPKAEFVLGGTEIGLGGVYRDEYAPVGMITISSSIADFNIFGEGVVKYGSDKHFLEIVDKSPTNPMGLEVVTYDDTLFFSATVGSMYNHVDEEGNFNFMVVLQYLYNGEGYEDKDFMKDNQAGVMMLLEKGEISSGDIYRPGQHYAAVSVRWNEIFNSDLSFSLFWIGNLVDGSGYVSPSFSYSPFDYSSLSVSFPFTYGDDGYEYTKQGRTLLVNLKFALGSGRF